MRLTKIDKKAFVKAVMGDVPQIDYKAQAQAAFEKWLVLMLPPKLAAVFADPQLKSALDTQWLDHSKFPLIVRYQRCGDYAENPPTSLIDELTNLDALYDEQLMRRVLLEEKLTGAIGGCSTLKTALARLPEFEKYLPADRDSTGVSNLPVANVVADLVKAGWPKHD